ncbi:membrane protein insertion efficiency factor YidD [Candidatus Microgenomates bacterium]|nr:membrane protein insertion efficiency factor YidD [Candidatus Microgenomates bacterium]
MRLYKYFILPIINQITGVPRSCRYSPSCSVYFEDAVKTYGAKGVWLGIKRVARCHPFSKGGLDLVPDKNNLSETATYYVSRERSKRVER